MAHYGRPKGVDPSGKPREPTQAQLTQTKAPQAQEGQKLSLIGRAWRGVTGLFKPSEKTEKTADQASKAIAKGASGQKGKMKKGKGQPPAPEMSGSDPMIAAMANTPIGGSAERLRKAVIAGDPDTISSIIAQDSTLAQKKFAGNTLLHVLIRAVVNGEAQGDTLGTVQTLIKLGTSVSETDSSGKTASQYARESIVGQSTDTTILLNQIAKLCEPTK